jgi:hypothetical protein
MHSSFQVITDLSMGLRFLALDEHLHLALFGPDDHGLLAHPAYHVEAVRHKVCKGWRKERRPRTPEVI